MPMNAAVILQLLIDVIAEAGTVAQTLQTAQANGLDITAAQLDDIRASYKDARAKLDAAIAAAGT